MSFKLAISAVKNVTLRERLSDVCPHWLDTNQQTNTHFKDIFYFKDTLYVKKLI